MARCAVDLTIGRRGQLTMIFRWNRSTSEVENGMGGKSVPVCGGLHPLRSKAHDVQQPCLPNYPWRNQVWGNHRLCPRCERRRLDRLWWVCNRLGSHDRQKWDRRERAILRECMCFLGRVVRGGFLEKKREREDLEEISEETCIGRRDGG